MQNAVIILIALAALGFLLAVISVLFLDQPLMGTSAEGFSLGCSNLALLAIALNMWSRNGNK